MKKTILLFTFITGLSLFVHAQHVSVRLDFPVGVAVRAPGPPPYAGAIWVGPEWRWQGGHYVNAPGYWSRPYSHYNRWTPGYWRYGRRGYVWVPGRWR